MNWISVDDRLPVCTEQEPENTANFSEKVLVYGYYGVGISELWDTGTDYGWNCCDSEYTPKNITHWMPLPEPPKEKQENE
jgi:hypothetical protein